MLTSINLDHITDAEGLDSVPKTKRPLPLIIAEEDQNCTSKKSQLISFTIIMIL